MATLRVLSISSSARQSGSVSRGLAGQMLEQLKTHHPSLQMTERDVSHGIPFVDEAWVEANFTPAEQRSEAQRRALALSDVLLDELVQSDILLLSVPIYNFAIPASLKAWIDMIARVGRSFRYTSEGPIGLLQNKKAIIMFASGGTAIGSELDFASAYLRHILGFIGIDDVSFISIAGQQLENDSAQRDLQEQLNELARQAA